ncbi:MAG: hypothetical protein MZW92_63220 [Comamonadaceae bacterium]|nr:hypothetical protein [Comamonadaceae bacterium]
MRVYSGALTQVKDQTVRDHQDAAGAAAAPQVVVQYRGARQGRADQARLPARQGRRRAGRSSTSTSAASGWCRATARSSRRSSAPAASTA